MTAKVMIRHRINRIAELASVAKDQGVELDLRSAPDAPGRLHVGHDPWTRGDDLERWLEAFRAHGLKGPVIFNTKEDGLEERISELARLHGVTSYFFLDTTLPTLVRLTAKAPHPDFAVRVSQFEPASAALLFRGRATWAWVDCFGGAPLPVSAVEPLRGAFRICLVSPELQRQDPGRIKEFAALYSLCDAVCTKVPERWQELNA